MGLFINDEPAKMDMEVETFRGEKGKLVGWDEPRTSASTGRVLVEFYEAETGPMTSSFYPSVINGEFK